MSLSLSVFVPLSDFSCFCMTVPWKGVSPCHLLMVDDCSLVFSVRLIMGRKCFLVFLLQPQSQGGLCAWISGIGFFRNSWSSPTGNALCLWLGIKSGVQASFLCLHRGREALPYASGVSWMVDFLPIFLPQQQKMTVKDMGTEGRFLLFLHWLTAFAGHIKGTL